VGTLLAGMVVGGAIGAVVVYYYLRKRSAYLALR
jgi:hypothetical protein